jgi:hypothetical protein
MLELINVDLHTWLELDRLVLSAKAEMAMPPAIRSNAFSRDRDRGEWSWRNPHRLPVQFPARARCLL